MKYDIICVNDWQEAMQEIKNNPPDLILMDIMLPEKNGFEITSEIREYEKQIGKKEKTPIVALTANTLDNDKEKCILAGMNDYLPKPFTPYELYDVVKRYTKKDK